MLASVTWTGNGGDLLWSNPANWSSNELPGAQDDVTTDTPELTSFTASLDVIWRASDRVVLAPLNIAE